MCNSIYKQVHVSVVHKAVSNYAVIVEMLKLYNMVEAIGLIVNR